MREHNESNSGPLRKVPQLEHTGGGFPKGRGM